MNDEINYKSNPLHGVSLKNLLIELVDHYGFEILYAYLNINCFKTNPSVESSIKFLKNTQWARESVEAFYLYQYKNLPNPSGDQSQLPPRDRVVPEDQTPKSPAELSLEDAEALREEREQKAAAYRSGPGKTYGEKPRHRQSKRRDDDRRGATTQSPKPESSSEDAGVDPWAKWRK